MAGTSTIIVRQVNAGEIIDLRHRILRAGMPRETACFEGDDDPGSVHFAAIAGDAVVGCATLHPSEYEGRTAFKLRGMAVEPSHQRRGVGRMLLSACERAAAERGLEIIWANCRKPAVPFYERLGWKIVSDEFEVPTAGPHFRMVRFRCD